ncbi:hypothetical protein BH11VER1_BH11VER1_06280 [soil metagenome]
MKHEILVLTALLLAHLSISAEPTDETSVIKVATEAYSPKIPKPTLTDVHYGEHERQVMDFWKAESPEPTPLVFVIHGGGWKGGSKERVDRAIDVEALLKAGISVVAINYRLIGRDPGSNPPVKTPLYDAARALQFVRSKASEWNLDKTRIGAAGGSAGGCSSLWLAFHDDLAAPQSADPISCESTRLSCAAVTVPQTTLDPAQMKAMTPNSKYGGHAFGLNTFEEFLASREKILPLIAEYSPYALVSADDPGIYMFFKAAPAMGQNQADPTHSANFGVKLAEHCATIGVPAELVFPGSLEVKHGTTTEYLIAKLKPTNTKAQRIDTGTSENRYLTADGAPLYDRWVRDYFDERFRLNDAAAFEKARHKYSGMVVTSQLRMWQVTGEESYLKNGRAEFAAMMKFAPGNPEILHDCFGFYPVLLAGKLLKNAGQFDPAWEEQFHSCAKFGMENFREQFPRKDGNQDLGRLCAIACALRLYPEEFASFRPQLDAFWIKLMSTGDLWLDSKTYTPVSVQYLCALADELGHVDDLRNSQGFHRMFGNFRDVLSPNGNMPEFGHAYFKTPGLSDWLYVFEWAAVLYDDPSFLYAAQKFFHGIVRQGKPTPKNALEASMTCHYCLIGLMPSDRTELITAKLGKCKSPAVRPALVSGITRRSVGGEGDRDAFLILRSSLDPGSPMLMMDLLSFGDHALFEQRPSIGYYESGHVPHFYQYGRYAQSASRGNVVLLNAPREGFPDAGWPENTWRTLNVPLERFDGTGRSRSVDQISIRTFGDIGIKNGQSLIIDNVRLSGPRGEMKLFDFENGMDWKGNKKLSIIDDDATSGSHALSVPIVTDGVSAKPLGLTVSLDDYQTFSIDAKWRGKTRPKAQVRPSVENTGWTQLESMTLAAHVKSASTEMRGQDAYARVEFDQYATFDSSLVRQIILTAEGIVIVRDDLTPGKTADGFNAGSLWQMYSVDAKGPQWFSTRGERGFYSADLADPKEYRAGMLAWFSGPPQQTIGLQEIPEAKTDGPTYKDLQRDKTWRVAYSRQTAKAGAPTWFSLVVLPHAADASPNELANGITVTESNAKSVYRVKTSTGYLQATIDKQGPWQIERQSSGP